MPGDSILIFKISQVLWVNCTSKNLRLFSLISKDLRWSQVSWRDLKSRQASISKYQMIWDDPTWTEVILEWSQVISADLKWCGKMPGDPNSISGSRKYFQLHCKNLWIVSVISQDLRWPQVMSSHVRKYHSVSDDLRWSQLNWGDLTWSQEITADPKWSPTTSGDSSWSQDIPSVVS